VAKDLKEQRDLLVWIEHSIRTLRRAEDSFLRNETIRKLEVLKSDPVTSDPNFGLSDAKETQKVNPSCLDCSINLELSKLKEIKFGLPSITDSITVILKCLDHSPGWKPRFVASLLRSLFS